MDTLEPKRIGIYGGTFDPIHIGHLRLALEAFCRLNLTQVRFIPCGKPPHRLPPFFSKEQRLQMVQLACQDFPYLIADDLEMQRQKPSWTIDTLRILRQKMPQDALFLLLGGDSFATLNSWKDWAQLLDFAHLVVIKRPNIDYPPKMMQYLREHQIAFSELKNLTFGKIITLENVPLLDISSQQIRAYLTQMRSIDFLVPKLVKEFINQQELFYLA